MLAEERRREILSLVEQNKSVTVEELTRLLDASESTVRRDLSQLSEMGRLKKVHGGATVIDRPYIREDQAIAEKSAKYASEKMAIASYAAGLIGEGDFVYIDAGTTTDRLVDCLGDTNALFMTNSIAHANKLALKGYRVMLPEGELKIISEAVVGPQTVESLKKYHFTKGFFGTNGVTDDTGFTTPEIEEAMVKHTAMGQCAESYVLCDSGKFEQVSPVTFADFEDAFIITDYVKNPKYRKYHHITEVAKP
jgi:DeoR family fructose operon transcriptional repressor